MNRLAFLLASVWLAASVAGVHHARAGQTATSPAASGTAKEADEAIADFVLPPPHGTPKQLTTGGTRGIRPANQVQPQAIMDLQPAGGRAAPRSLTGARQP